MDFVYKDGLTDRPTDTDIQPDSEAEILIKGQRDIYKNR